MSSVFLVANYVLSSHLLILNYLFAKFKSCSTKTEGISYDFTTVLRPPHSGPAAKFILSERLLSINYIYVKFQVGCIKIKNINLYSVSRRLRQMIRFVPAPQVRRGGGGAEPRPRRARLPRRRALRRRAALAAGALPGQVSAALYSD